MIDDLKKIKSGSKELKEFGVVVGAVFIVLGDLALMRGRTIAPYLLGFGAALFFLGVFRPAVLKPLQKAWMALAVVIGFFMSRLILSLLFYAVITPIGLMMKIFGKDILDERIDMSKASYWHPRPSAPKRKESYENQY